MRFIVRDWYYGVKDLEKILPMVKWDVFGWTETKITGTKRKREKEVKQRKERFPYVELSTMEELLSFIKKYNNVQIRRPTDSFPFWYLYTSVLHGHFRPF